MSRSRLMIIVALAALSVPTLVLAGGSAAFADPPPAPIPSALSAPIGPAPAASSPAPPSSPGVLSPSSGVEDGAVGRWLWPVAGRRAVLEPFRAPAHDYGPGHRGVDIAAAVGADVRAPAAGVVAFRGTVVDRAVLTIDHGAGRVTTFEPVDSDLAVGAAVEAGDPIGMVAVGGHAPPGALHIGLRVDGAYVDPMRLFGPVPRAVLLPCCAPR